MPTLKTLVRTLFAAFFVGAGITHFTNRAFFVAIVPPYLPWPGALVFVSGVAEILLGALLMFPPTVRLAGWGLVALLIAVFPANLHMAMHPDLFPALSRAALWARLPLQGVLIVAAYWYAR